MSQFACICFADAFLTPPSIVSCCSSKDTICRVLTAVGRNAFAAPMPAVFVFFSFGVALNWGVFPGWSAGLSNLAGVLNVQNNVHKCSSQRFSNKDRGQRTPSAVRGAVRGAENEKNVFWVEEEGSWLCPPVILFESRKERKKHYKCGYFFSLSLQQPWEFLRKLVLIPSSVSRDSTLCFLEFESEFDRISSSSRTHTRAHSHIFRSHFSCIYPLESEQGF